MQFKFFPVFTEYSVSVFARLCSTAGYYISLQIFFSLAHKLALVFATGGVVMFAVYYWLIQPKQTDILGVIFANLAQVTWMAMGCAITLLSAYPELKHFSPRQNFSVFSETFGKIFQQGKPFVVASFTQQLAFILTGMMLTDGVQRAAYQIPQVLLVSWFSVFPSVGQRLQSQVALLPSDETFGSKLKKLFGTAMAASLIISAGIFIFTMTNLSSMMNVLLASDDPRLRFAATQVTPWVAATTLIYGLTAGVSALMRGVKNPASDTGRPYQNISVTISSLSSLAGFFMGFAMNEKHNTGALGFALTALGAQAVNLVMQSGLALRALQNRNSESQQSVSQILFGCRA